MKIFINQLFLFTVILSGIYFLCFSKALALAQETREEIINPHWTGRYCQECHLKDNPRQEGAALKFNGDTGKLCNRCHETDYARTDIHPVEIVPSKKMIKSIPPNLPLKNGKIDCLTCHDATIQMKSDFASKTVNPKFLRGAPYENLVYFCFSCHRKHEYTKVNPHQQIDPQGKIIENRCLFCHLSLPNPLQVENIGEVNFKTELACYCISCHSQEKSGHPSRSDHLKKLTPFMQESLTSQTEVLQVDLPLDDKNVFCGTCHNPHAKGVIQRKEARFGAGEKLFLRLNEGYDLCISCHGDKKRTEATEQIQPQKPLPEYRSRIKSSHKPMTENKCKLCHAITPEKRQMPDAMFLCFKQGCHETNILAKEYVHEKTVAENCYLCHRGHSSVYKKLQEKSETNLCRACHPLLKIKNETLSDNSTAEQKSSEQPVVKGKLAGRFDNSTTNIVEFLFDENSSETEIAEKQESFVVHDMFMQYLKTTPIPEGNECGFCHSPLHKAKINQLDLETCADCHRYVQETLSNNTTAVLNVHQTFEKKLCSACHDPHSALYPYLLKDTQESYYETDSEDTGNNTDSDSLPASPSS
jgi:predicted CXXCH cytochrome family protein